MSFEFESRFFCDILRDQPKAPAHVLVIGCGSGVEARHIAAATGATVTGLDLDVSATETGDRVNLMRSDARRLPFRDGTFDAVYCYHVLEHVPGPERAVEESRRVVRHGGIAFFGTPNKSRLIGYAGGRGALREKIWWNIVDYGKRLTGRWSNEKGAHAGFTGRELARLVGSAFERVESVSLPYYLGKYPGLASMWRTTFRMGLAQFIAPSVYVRALASAAQGSNEKRTNDAT